MGTSTNQDDLRQLLGIQPIQQKTTPNQDDLRKILGIVTTTPQQQVTPTQQTIPTQPEEQKLSGLEWWERHISDPVLGTIGKIDKPMLEKAQAIEAKRRQIFGIVPKATDLQNAITSKNYGKISRWYQDGKIPTEDQIKSQLNQQEAESLINELKRASKGKIFSELGTAISRGTIVPIEGKSFIGKLGASIYNILQGAISPEQVLVPSQLAINLATLGVGGRIATITFDNAIKKGLTDLVKAGEMSPEAAKQVFTATKYYAQNTTTETLQAVIRGEIPAPKVPGQWATTEMLARKAKPTVSTGQRAGIEYAPTQEEIRIGKKPIPEPVRGAIPTEKAEPITPELGVRETQLLVEPSVIKPSAKTPADIRAEQERQFAEIFPDLAEKIPESPAPPLFRVSKNPEIQRAYETALNNIPPKFRKDINIKGVRMVEFEGAMGGEGQGGKLYVKDNGDHYILIEKGNPEPLAETIFHEALHSYVANHPELVDQHNYFGPEKATRKIEAQIYNDIKQARAKINISDEISFLPDEERQAISPEKAPEKPIEIPPEVKATEILQEQAKPVEPKTETPIPEAPSPKLQVKVSEFVESAYEEFEKPGELTKLLDKTQDAYDLLAEQYPDLAKNITSVTINRRDVADIARGGVSSVGRKGDIEIDPAHAKRETAESLAHEMMHVSGATEEEARAFEDLVKPRAIPEAPKVSPEEANVSLEKGEFPHQQVGIDEIAVKPELMQFKQIENIATGTNKADTLQGQWDELKGGVVILWKPKNPAEYGLGANEKYIIANGHHRLDFAKRNNVKSLWVQVLDEADGYSASNARAVSAETNIAQGGGNIYDQVKYLRERTATLGKDEALGAGRRIGAKGRQATTIAFDAEDSAYSAFINGDITPEQTEIIARTAPNDELAQRFGVKQALAGKQGYELQNIIKASQVEKAQNAAQGIQLDLLGESDEAYQRSLTMAKVATEYPKQIREQLRTIQGAGKRPDIARQFGIDVNDPMALQGAIDKMKYDLQRWENWSQYPDLVAKVRQKFEANEAVNYKQETLDLGAKGETTDQVAQAKNELDDFINKNAEKVSENIREKTPSGGLSMRIIKKKGGQAGTLPKEPPIANKELAETLATGEKSRMARTKEAINRTIHNVMDIATARMEANLMRSAKEYPDAIPQFNDNIRTELYPIGQRATESADKALFSVWGDIVGKERTYLMRMIGLRALRSRKELGLSVSRDIELDAITKEIDNLTSLLQKSDQGKEVLERVETFKELMRQVGNNLVARGKLKPEALDAQDFYFPFTPQEYFQNYNTLPRRARRVFRGYTLEAKGTTRDVVMTEDAARMYVAQVHMDNAIDDFTLNNVSQFDVYAKTLKSKTDDELKAIFHNDDFNISPNHQYNIDGKWYKAYQEQPGNIKYVGDTVNVKKLVEEDIPDIISQGENISNDEILDRLESLRKGLIVGSKYKSYLIPTPIADRLLKLRQPSGEFIPGVYDAARLTRMWKAGTLTYAGLPYQTLNLVGDLANVYITSEGAFNPVTMRSAGKVLNYAKDPVKYGQNYLNAFEKEVCRIAQEKDVLGSGFMSEWRHRARPLNIPGYQKIRTKWERFNYTRESIPRLIELTYQWDRHVKGKGFVGEAFKKDIAKLDPESAAGFIARNATVDYRAVPDWYRRNMNGLLFPFLTWSQKNIVNLAKQFRTPMGALKMGAKVGLPFAAAYAYNNTGDRKYIYDRLGYFQNRSSTVIIKGEDLDNDGKPEQAWIFSPQLPWDSATEIMGWSKIAPLVNQVHRGMITPEKATKTFASGLWKEPARHLARMTTPILQFFIGVSMDKDPVDKQPIIPQALKNATDTQKAPYWRNYLLEKTLSPFGQYIRQADKGEATNAFGLLSKGPFDWVRALGLYKVNLVSNEAKELLSLATKEEGQKAYYLYRYKQAYIEGDIKKQSDILKEAKDKGYLPSGESLLRGIKSETVQKKLLLHKMSESDQSNYITDMVDDMIGDSPIKSLMAKITSPKITKEQKQDYQNTLDAKLYRDALKLAMKNPNLMKRLKKAKGKEPAKPTGRKAIGQETYLREGE